LVKKGNANNNNAKWETLDEMTQVRKAFEYVRKMVKLWVREFEEGESYWANELLRHFHKWISSQSCALYDPLLTRLVNELMKKVFHLLSKRLEQLGLHLVFANFSKLLVATSKHTPN
jgi:DNA polymerase epsilon subunit 1